MVKRIITAIVLCLVVSCVFGPTVEAKKRSRRTTNTTASASGLSSLERKVVGKHMLSLQWISWDYFGEVNITKDADGTLRCVGHQDSRENDDFVSLDGTITIIDANHLQFTGKIITKIYHINSGEEVVRDGTYDFEVKGGRRYWRLQQMENPADGCVDYIDIYFKR